jgi:hypothetical protein
MRAREASILWLSLVVGAVRLGAFHYQGRQGQTTLGVTGSATRPFDSDVIKWRVQLARSVAGADMKSAYAQLRGDLQLLMAELAAAGIADSSITERPVSSQPIFDREGRSGGYRLVQEVLVISRDIPALERLAVNPAALMDKGVMLDNSYVEYHDSKIADLKRDLLATATLDARRRAERIASTTGSRLSKMRAAGSGVFQINEPYSNSVDDYGVYSASTRKKEITITVHAEFGLR